MSYGDNIEFPAKLSINDAVRKAFHNRKAMNFVVPGEHVEIGLSPL